MYYRSPWSDEALKTWNLSCHLPTIFSNNIGSIWYWREVQEWQWIKQRNKKNTKIKLWKMSKTAIVGVYIISAMFAMADFCNKLISLSSLLNAYMHLTVVRYWTKPVLQVCMMSSSHSCTALLTLIEYTMLISLFRRTWQKQGLAIVVNLKIMKEKTEGKFLKYLVHSVLHVCADAEKFQAHLGCMCNYVFINFLMEWVLHTLFTSSF